MAGLDWDEELIRATGKLITSLVRLTLETETTRNTKMPARKVNKVETVSLHTFLTHLKIHIEPWFMQDTATVMDLSQQI